MMQQLQIPEWGTSVGIIAFFVTLTVFAAIVIYTMRMPRKKIEKLENLPWTDDQKP